MMENTNTITLNAVRSVTATLEPDVFILDITMTDANGEQFESEYASRPDDMYGLGPVIRQWLVDNEGKYVIEPFVPETIEQVRENMRPLSPRQLRLALVREGHSLLSVTAALDSLPAGQAKEEAEIEWEYATEYKRLAPALLTIAQAIGLSPEEVDTMWEKALLI
jgi:hypothetical protein